MDFSPLRQTFEEHYGLRAVVIASAPGRLEVLGNHTDYNAGLTLSCAVGFRCYVAIAKLDQPVAKLASTAFDSPAQSFSLEQPDVEAGHWARYVLGLVDGLKRRGHDVPGFAMLVDSQVPRSAGVSSSAALEMAALTGILSLMQTKLPADEMARIGQDSESRAVGAQTGLLDQFTSVLGQCDRLLKIDFQSMQVQTIPTPPGWCFVAVDSGAKHDLTKEYNARRRSCEAAARAMGIDAVRDASLDTLASYRNDLSSEDHGCALHIVEENQRVNDAVRLLASRDMAGFGQLLFDSHESSRLNFKNSCPELDELVRFGQEDPRCIGARLSGGGFGGISIHLVEIDHAEAYRMEIVKAMGSLASGPRWSAVCEIGRGAAVDER